MSGYAGNIELVTSSTGSHLFISEGGERLRIASNGNIGIGTNAPAGKLDIYDGFIYSNGNKQPFSRTGTVSGVNYVDIPVFFDLATTNVLTCEIVFTWQINRINSTNPTLSIYQLIGGTQYSPASEIGYKETSFSQSTYTGGIGNILARTIEIGIGATTKIRISKPYNYEQYSAKFISDTIYCTANVGTTQNCSIGWFAYPGITHIRLLLSSQTYNLSIWNATYYHV
jgi:hypothetical protein